MMMRTWQNTTINVVRKVINSTTTTHSRCLASTAGTAKFPDVVIDKSVAKAATAQPSDPKIAKENCGTTTPDDELEELEEMFIMGPAGIEWNGPTRGGARPEPTRYKDWERKGRCTDF